MKHSKTALLSWQALKHRRWLAGVIFFFSQCVAVACWFVLPHQYLSQAVVLLDPGPSPTRLVANDERANVLAAKVSLLTSSLVAEEVIRTTGLDRSDVMRENWETSAPAGMSYEQWLQSVVMAGIVPDGSRGSMVLKIGYAATTPEPAKALANAYADALIRVSDLLNKGADRFADQAFASAQARSRLELKAAQEVLRQRGSAELMGEGLTDPGIRAFLSGSRQTSAFVRSHLEGQAQQRVLEQGRDPGSLLDDAFLNTHRQKLSVLTGQRAEAKSNFGDGHPVVKALDASIRAVEATIEAHERKRRAASALGVQLRGDVARSVSGNDVDTRATLLEREQRRLSYEASRQGVESAGERYEESLTNAEVAVLNREAPRADVRLMSAATTPIGSWFPQLAYYVPVSLSLGLILAWLGAGVMERTDRRVRTLGDVSEVVGSGQTWALR
ncbi:MAG: hypothetical protein PSV21_08595 [Aquabacterium sp.]|jgi:uncharacterized protein involved in exopolysaccharide biosynthesis|nr:hypothetical protein [Aquabacterium sp.]MDI1349272.1 hypothetical protein [Aquabacterium sp.]